MLQTYGELQPVKYLIKNMVNVSVLTDVLKPAILYFLTWGLGP